MRDRACFICLYPRRDICTPHMAANEVGSHIAGRFVPISITETLSRQTVVVDEEIIAENKLPRMPLFAQFPSRGMFPDGLRFGKCAAVNSEQIVPRRGPQDGWSGRLAGPVRLAVAYPPSCALLQGYGGGDSYVPKEGNRFRMPPLFCIHDWWGPCSPARSSNSYSKLRAMLSLRSNGFPSLV